MLRLNFWSESVFVGAFLFSIKVHDRARHEFPMAGDAEEPEGEIVRQHMKAPLAAASVHT